MPAPAQNPVSGPLATSANTSVVFTRRMSASSLMFLRSGPARIGSLERPTWLARLAATRRLSPVIIFSVTPSSCSARIVSLHRLAWPAREARL